MSKNIDPEFILFLFIDKEGEEQSEGLQGAKYGRNKRLLTVGQHQRCHDDGPYLNKLILLQSIDIENKRLNLFVLLQR